MPALCGEVLDDARSLLADLQIDWQDQEVFPKLQIARGDIATKASASCPG